MLRLGPTRFYHADFYQRICQNALITTAGTRNSDRVPFCVGNDSGGECGVAVARRFLMPGAAGLGGYAAGPCNASGGSGAYCRAGASAAANPPFWYSFEYGSVHFAVISTEHDLTDGSDQRAVRAARAASQERHANEACFV